jgi:hypothetical protein
MDDQPSAVEPGDRRPARQLERPPSERYAASELPDPPEEATPPLARAIVAAFLAAIAGGVAIAVAGGILTMTAGLLIVAGVVGWVVAVVFGLALEPTPSGGRGIRRSITAVIALVGVTLGQVGLWLIAREEGGTLGVIDYLAEVFGFLVPVELALAAMIAWWRTG